MDRRHFLAACTTSTASTLFATTEQKKISVLPTDVRLVITETQQHMFPEDCDIPGAKSFGAAQFLEETVMHTTYDRDIRTLVIEGSRELQQREGGRFLMYDAEKMEKALRTFEKSEYGARWLERIMLLSIEALLSDPIYGGNYCESGWAALQTKGGDPRPAVRYAGI